MAGSGRSVGDGLGGRGRRGGAKGAGEEGGCWRRVVGNERAVVAVGVVGDEGAAVVVVVVVVLLLGRSSAVEQFASYNQTFSFKN